MKKINCVIIDDDPNSVLLIGKYLEDFEEFTKKGAFVCPVKALETIPQIKPELIFLDVHMPRLNGMELIEKLGPDFDIILTTGSEDYALQSYEYNVIDYLLKPITTERFTKSINKFKEKRGYKLSKNNIELAKRVSKTNVISVKHNYRTVQIPLNKILYLESNREYVKIATSDGIFKTKQSLSYFERELKSFSFLRIHRSFIVPSDRIISYSSTEVNVEDLKLPVGRSYQKVLTEIKSTA